MADQEIPANSQAETKSPVSVQEFSKKIKEKYPSYKDVDDMELATKIVEKYPEYKNKVHFDAAPSPSTTGTPPIDYGPFNPEDIDKHPQTKQNYERWKTDQSQEPPKEGESKNQPYIKKLGNVLGNGLATGAAMLNRGIADTPEYLDRFGDALIVNPIRNLLGMEPVHVGGAGKFLGTDKISEYYAKQQDAYNKNIEKTIDDTGKGIWADVGNKDYANASLRLAAGLAESASASIAMMAMPAAGIGALGSIGAGTVIFGSSKMRELDESSPNMSEEAKMINATVNGALEGIFETFFGSGAVGGSLSKMVKSVGRKEGEVIVEKGIRGAVSDLILKYPALAPLGEAYEEAATQMAQNATDILTGNTNVKSVFEGVADAATIGAVSGGVHGGTIRAVSSITKKINDKIDTSVLNSANTEGIDAFGNVVSRTKVKKFHEQATSDLGDIPNANYTEAVNNLIENYTDPTEIITQLNKLSDDMVVSQSEYQKAFNFIKSSFTVNSMNKAKMANIQEGIDKFQDSEGNMVSATINGEQFFIRNSEDLGQEGRTIFAKNSKGEVKPFRADQVTEWEVQSPDDIINLTNTNEQSEDDQYNAIEELNNKAAKKGIVPEKSVHTPNGIAKVSAINEDSTITVINQKGEPSIYSIDEIAPYKTDEQKQQEKDQLKKEEEGIAMIPEMFKLDGNVYQWTNDINSVVRDEEGEITGFNVTNQDTGETEQLNADQMNDVLSRYAQDAKPDNKQEATRTETKEEVPQEEAQPEIPMDKEGNPDYDQMEPEMFFTQYSEEFGEEDARNEVKGMQKAITDKIKKLTAKKEKATTPNQRASIAREIKAMGSQLEGINKIIESDRPTEDTGNDTQWIAENSNDPIEIALAFEQENQNTPSNQLTEWQQATLGVKFNPESFNRFSDKNNTTQTLAKTWLRKDGVSIDQFIKDNFEDTPGFENVTEQDVIDFILANPSGNIRSTTDTQNELRRKYREQTGTSIDNHQFDQETLPTQAKLESFLADNNITDWFTTEDLIELVKQNKSKLNENDYNDFTEYLNTEIANQQSSTNEWLDEETDSGVQEQVDSSKENGNESIVSTTEEPAVKDNNPAVDNANVDQKASETPVNTEVPIESGETILEQSEKLDPESSPKNLNISEAAQADLKDRRNALNALDKISTELGQSAEVVNSSEIPENVKKEKRQRIAEGKETVGFYNPEDGKIYIISDRITKVSEAKKTFIHELVVHKGLKGLFETENPQSILGKQYGKFNDLMLDVFGSMTEEEIERTRKSYFSNIDIEFFTNSKYNKRNEVSGGGTRRSRARSGRREG